VAVDPDALSSGIEAADVVESRQDCAPLREDRVGLRASRLGEAVEAPFEQFERRLRVCAHIASKRLERLSGERLGFECRAAAISQRQMELSGAFAECCRAEQIPVLERSK